MAFVAEDGTGLADANSYATVEYADEYFFDRGNETWADSDSGLKESALINATDFINMRWGTDPGFKGMIGTETQALLWPRLYAGDSALQMPDTLKRATVEYALRALSNPLAPDIPYDESGRLVTKKREEVGPIVEEVSYASNSATNVPTWLAYPLPDSLMRSLIIGGGFTGRVIRN
jgi:hypothetical protein